MFSCNMITGESLAWAITDLARQSLKKKKKGDGGGDIALARTMRHCAAEFIKK